MAAILAHDGAVRIYDSGVNPGVIPAGIPAILLAAGKSTRMGRSKALLPLGPGETAETFLTHLTLCAEKEHLLYPVFLRIYKQIVSC